MFVRFDPDWPPLDPPKRTPEPTPKRLDPQQEKRLMLIIGVNALLLFVAPIGGATVIGALLRWWG